MRFNQSKPADYNAHSVSMGDVVAIQRKNGTKWYYYDSYGWKLFCYSTEKRQQLREI